MAFVQREMSGSLFPNDRKTADNQPDFKGECLIDGVTYEIGGWSKTAKNGTGREFTSLSFKVKSATYRTEPPAERPLDRRAPPPQAEDDLPF